MPRPNAYTAAHLEWIGFVRPTGLVVSPTALVRAGVVLDRRDAEGQHRLNDWASEGREPAQRDEPLAADFRSFAATVLGWSFSPRGYAGTAERPIPEDLTLAAPDAGHLKPDYAVRMERERRARRGRRAEEAQADGSDEARPWQLLVCNLRQGEDFDAVSRRTSNTSDIEASAHSRMERLLGQTGAPAGLLFNGEALRLISAPLGENSGWLDFRISDMRSTAGRPILTAMRALLSEDRLLLVHCEQRLAALLRDSRKYQNEVSERLAEQVLHALYELLRGFQTAHDASKGVLLAEPLKRDPDHVYRGLLTVVLRMVFLFYAEERDMLPQDEVFVRGYSLASLYERLRGDAALHPDTMDQRFGAWAQFLVLTRMVHDGARAGSLSLPPRQGALFDPDSYRFLEGRAAQLGGARRVGERIEAPLVPDGTLYRVLEKLIVLDGERISYRALDVEHVGSVYETMMGFRLETAPGRAIAIKAAKKHGAPATVAIEGLLAEEPAKRAKWLQDRTDRKLTDRVRRAVRDADTVEAALAALDSVIDKQATPDIVPAGSMVLQPSEERRRSGSHYTPRELTEPIVRDALEPILDALRDGDRPPTPEQILDIKVCDPAMGSGAFLVEACRQLGEALVAAWHRHGSPPDVPADEDEVVFARRLVAQRCLYGVDRNPAAVDLAKLSLWLVTLAREHPLTFLDHALRHGDSLVGLTLDQIRGFHWQKDKAQGQEGMEALQVQASMAAIEQLRQRIREADDDVPDFELRRMWDEAHFESGKVALLGDLVLAAFFERTKAKEREALRRQYAMEVAQDQTEQYRSWLADRRTEEPPLATFHWQVEFPEVFGRANPGFDAIVGNPPFAGKNTVSGANVPGYPDWLKLAHPESHGNADLVAHFFRRAFNLLRTGGTFGLIATNTIAQGDTRSTGLRWICENGGTIYQAQRRLKWPGLAAVVVSVLHVAKGDDGLPRVLDGKKVEQITAFLFHRGGHRDPQRLKANEKLSFQGSIVLGMGFTFDDTDKKGVATPLAEMRRLIAENPRNQEVIFPYIGGEEVNTSPTHEHHRYVINFHDWPLRREDIGELWAEASPERRPELRRQAVVPVDYPEPVAADWPELLAIVEEKVRPERLALRDKVAREQWWRFLRPRPELRRAVSCLDRVLLISRVGQQAAFTFLSPDRVYADSIIVIPVGTSGTSGAFCTLQSRPHEIWARFFASSLEDRLRYTPSDCFETFPFPRGWRTNRPLEAAGKAYYNHRAALMVETNEGLTKTYNRFHDPNETTRGVVRLRDLHADMDRALLDAYGWPDIPTGCEFLLDYPIDAAEWGARKKPYRYRWPDDIRDEVLARLLDLNAQRIPQ